MPCLGVLWVHQAGALLCSELYVLIADVTRGLLCWHRHA
jgi:hypothetical protein